MIDLTPKNLITIPAKEKVVLPAPQEDIAKMFGGWQATQNELRKGNVSINAKNEQILLGSATAPLTGIGIFLGKDSSDYEFRAGNPSGDYIHWDGSALVINGMPLQNNFGDGSDGDVIISADTTITRDMYYNNLTINS